MKKPTIKARNPVAPAARCRKAGAHGKTHKARRRQDRVDLRRGE